MKPASVRWLALLGLLWSACVASTPAVREEAETPETVSSSWEDARSDPSCVVPLCSEEHCAIWRCQDVTEVDTRPVLLAQAMVPGAAPVPIPEPVVEEPLVAGASPSRWWGIPLAAPGSADAVFEIPWHDWKTRERSAPKLFRHQCLKPREPIEKHHIFPQEERLARWVTNKGIDIHAFTIRLPQSVHRWLHSGGPSGGQWNEAWRQFFEKNGSRAEAADIWRFAGELMIRFDVNGPFVPYYCD